MGPTLRDRFGTARGLLIDVEPLRRDIDFRRMWAGQSVSVIGSQITRVALPYQMYVLTGSTLALAALVLVQLVPLLLFTLGGGVIADALDRRRVLLVSQVGLLATSLALALITSQQSPSVIALFGVAFLASAFMAFEWPARSSAIPRLVPKERLRAAIALGQLSYNGGSVLGPAVAGALIATIGTAGAFGIDVLTYAFSLAMIIRLRPIPPVGERRTSGLEAIREGLRFVRLRRLILSTFAIDLNAMVFGSPRTLFPVLALDVFKVGPVGLGFLTAAPAAGALIAILVSGGISRYRRIGRGIIVAVAGWGVAMALFGLATGFYALALVLLAIAGAADVVSAVFRSSVVQMETPDELRGRVAAIHVLVVTSGPQVGDIEAALLASVIGAQLSVLSGGILCLVGVAVVAKLFPELDAHVLRDESAPIPEPGQVRESSPRPGPEPS